MNCSIEPFLCLLAYWYYYIDRYYFGTNDDLPNKISNKVGFNRFLRKYTSPVLRQKRGEGLEGIQTEKDSVRCEHYSSTSRVQYILGIHTIVITVLRSRYYLTLFSIWYSCRLYYMRLCNVTVSNQQSWTLYRFSFCFVNDVMIL